MPQHGFYFLDYPGTTRRERNMLDQGISLRCLLSWVAGIVAVVVTVIGWICDREALGRLGLTFTALGCTLWILQDGARTRRCLRVLARPEETRPTISRVP